MDGYDPYRAPVAAIAETATPVPLESATKVRRFFNWLIDKVVILGTIVAIGFFAALLGGDAVSSWLDAPPWWAEYLIEFAVFMIYYTLMEGIFGFSIGKLLTGTRVVDESGNQPTPARALLRSVCRLIPFDALSLLISDDDVRRGWHDSLSRTYVVMRRPSVMADRHEETRGPDSPGNPTR